jgi:hypothetical protein
VSERGGRGGRSFGERPWTRACRDARVPWGRQ